MAQRNIAQFNSQMIGHNAKQKLLCVDASTLMLRPGHNWEQLYDDACDVGMAMRNPRNGNVTRWYLCEGETVNCPDGDVVCWVLKPTSETVYRNPMLKGYTLKIYND